MRIPRATYRLQLHAGFTFADAEAIVPYLAELGVSDLYLSPFLKARAGSMHGYDIIDHGSLNAEIGDMAALERLHAAARRLGMGIIMDFVPNHMGVGGADNSWWLDVLEWGEDSPYARFFDIDWAPARRELKGKVLLPFLGDHYGAILERGELVPRFDRGSGTFSVWYWEHRYPIAVRDYVTLLERVPGDALHDLVLDFRGFARGHGAGRTIAARRARAAELKAALAAIPAESADAIDAALAGLPAADLHQLLERQAYRVSFWRVAADEINYRRFFDINDLAALRMVEEPELFELAHRFMLELIRRGLVDGVRIDHVDGLFNPAEYCRLLQRRAGEVLGRPPADPMDQPVWLVVEKILAHHEQVRRDWPVAGTTGYEFMNQVAGLFVDPAGEASLTAAYGRFIGVPMNFEREVIEAKKRIIDEHMASELRVLAVRLGRIALSHWRSRDFTLSVLYTALKEVVACLPVYRTYITSRRVTDTDRRYIGWAVELARLGGAGDASVWDFVEGVLTTRLAREAEAGYARRAIIDFAMRLQQYSGPVMAKGFEDTALYRFNRLLALNEVGGDPTRFGMSPGSFHQIGRIRLRSHPHGLLATATHDSKRGEDVRVRIAAISEMPDEWRQHVERWSQLNAPFRAQLAAGPAPEPNDEWFLYQTMVGAWPHGGDSATVEGFVERLVPAMLKSVKEAKRRTSWARPDEAYEQAVDRFIHRICETDRRNPFLEDFLEVHRRLCIVGMVHSLAQTLLKLTVPGVPDLYQGTELWDLSLVDPDNRRPVDYGSRMRSLGSLAGPLPADVGQWRDGAVKQELIRRTLALRARHEEMFQSGSYRPLAARGPRADNVVAFARQNSERVVVVVVPRLLAGMWPEGQEGPPLGAAWRGVTIDAPRRGPTGQGRFTNLLTGEAVVAAERRGVPVFVAADLFASFPLALLEQA
ncbi:MAG: malto-oligosyltrehalose synthase [Solirubrobacterales bacterium]